MKKRIYLDNHATTQVRDEVLQTMLPYFIEKFGNASSSTHSFGWETKKAVEEARHYIASLINTVSQNIIFTSGATESNNLVIKGLCDAASEKIHIITSSIEHDCILEALYSKKNECEFTLLPVNHEGVIDVDYLQKSIRPNTRLISIMFANNEIGTIQPIKEIGELCRNNSILFHTDAAQALGKIAIDVKELGIDLLSASAHKFYGPKGVGFLYINRNNKDIVITRQMSGGHQEYGYRSGTLNVPGIVGLGTAAKLAKEEFTKEFWHIFNLRNTLYDKLTDSLSVTVLNGPSIRTDILTIEEQKKTLSAEELSKLLKRLPHNIHVSFKNIQAADLFSKLKHIALSSGSACSSSVATASHVLTAIGLEDDKIKSSVRFGIGHHNTDLEISEAAESLVQTLKLFN